MPDLVGGVSGDVAIDVDDSGRTGGGDVAGFRAGVFVFLVDANDGRRDTVHAI